jgi:hypothetical protein
MRRLSKIAKNFRLPGTGNPVRRIRISSREKEDSLRSPSPIPHWDLRKPSSGVVFLIWWSLLCIDRSPGFLNETAS